MSRVRNRKIDWPACFRLIPSRFPPVQLYEGVSAPQDWEAVKRIEELTNPRLRRGAGKPLNLLNCFGYQALRRAMVPRKGLGPDPSNCSKNSHLPLRQVQRSYHWTVLMSPLL